MIKHFFVAMLFCVASTVAFSGCGAQTDALENASQAEIDAYEAAEAAAEAQMDEEMAGGID